MLNFKGILKTIQKIRYRSPKPIFCPKCKSSKIHPKESYGILPITYRCRDCGYDGILIFELEKTNNGNSISL